MQKEIDAEGEIWALGEDKESRKYGNISRIEIVIRREELEKECSKKKIPWILCLETTILLNHSSSLLSPDFLILVLTTLQTC